MPKQNEQHEEAKHEAPIYKLYASGITVSVWDNTSKDGKKYQSLTIDHSFKDDNGEYKNMKSLFISSIPALIGMLNVVYTSYGIMDITKKAKQ